MWEQKDEILRFFMKKHKEIWDLIFTLCLDESVLEPNSVALLTENTLII